LECGGCDAAFEGRLIPGQKRCRAALATALHDDKRMKSAQDAAVLVLVY
jgi:hypothetical protein